jgi:hypothetical protein
MNHGKKLTTQILGILIIVFSALFVISCSSSTSPKVKKTSPNDTSILSAGAHPQIGTSFTDSAYIRDSSLNIIAGSGTKIVYTLVDTNSQIGGKSNVYEFTSSVDTIYLHYETSGDFSYYTRFGLGSFQIGSEWITFPTQTQGTIPITSFSSPVLTDTIQITGSTKGHGVGTSLIGKESLPAGKTIMSADAYALKLKTHSTATVTIFFASGLDFFTGYDVTTSGNFGGVNLGGGVHRFLIDYDLK